MEKLVEVPEALVAAIHDYLTLRPMREVEGLVHGLRQCQPKELENKAGLQPCP